MVIIFWFYNKYYNFFQCSGKTSCSVVSCQLSVALWADNWQLNNWPESCFLSWQKVGWSGLIAGSQLTNPFTDRKLQGRSWPTPKVTWNPY